MTGTGKRGSALVLVVVAAGFLLILTGAAYRYLRTSVDTQMWTRERIQAKLTAEAGVNLATHMLVAGASLPTGDDAQVLLGTETTPEPLPNGMGAVYVSVDPNNNNDDIISANSYMINCLATVPGENFDTYGIQAIVMPLNLARFSVFMDNPSLSGAYVDGYRFDGPFYANGPVRVISNSAGDENDPFFYSFTLTSDYYISDWGTTQATTPESGNLRMRPFERLSLGLPYFELGADTIPFGPDEINWEGVRNAAISGGLYFTPDDPVYTIYDGSRIKLKGDSLLVKLDDSTPERAYYLADLDNPVVWFENGNLDTLMILGHGYEGLDSALTIGMNGNLYLGSAIRYTNEDPEDPLNHTLLGLMTIHGDIIIKDDFADTLYQEPGWDGFNIVTHGDFQVDAVLLALEGNLKAEKYWEPEDGPHEFRLLGGYMIQEEGYTSSGDAGFDISVYFDPRLLSMHPPFFPTTANWSTTMWREDGNMERETVTNGQQNPEF